MPKADYEERKEARIDRLRGRADNARSEADRRLSRAQEMASIIPLGQPILVGHHSEKRDRNYRSRIEGNFRKGMEANSKAKVLDRRAEAAESNRAISSDDPEAVRKLKEKLTGMEEIRDYMKTVNSAWRKAGKPKADNLEGWEKMSSLSGLSMERLGRSRMEMARDFISRAPYTYHLTNLGGNIKRVKERIAALGREEGKPEVPDRESPAGFTVSENTAENRLQLFFPGKPPEATRVILKRAGFRWSPRQGAWQRLLNNSARYAADRIAVELRGEANAG